jgi:hypothetical protein
VTDLSILFDRLRLWLQSLLPILRGEITARPVTDGIGIHGSFPYGDTNHVCDKDVTTRAIYRVACEV